MKLPVFGCLFFLLASALANAAVTSTTNGKIYLRNTSRTTPAYLFKRTETKLSEGKSVRVEYLSTKGELLVEEIYHYMFGKLVHYTYKQMQVGDNGEFRIDGKRIAYEFTRDGKTDRDEDDVPKSMLFGDNLQSFIAENWDRLVKEGKTLRTRYLVLERQDDFGFKFFAGDERACGTETCREIIMKPSSFLIAAVVGSIKVLVDPNKRIREIDGRMPIRQPKNTKPKKRSDYKSIDAVLVFE